MKFLLRLKHWQLFLITWGGPILLNLISFSNPAAIGKGIPLCDGIFHFRYDGVDMGYRHAASPFAPARSKLKYHLVQSPISYSGILHFHYHHFHRFLVLHRSNNLAKFQPSGDCSYYGAFAYSIHDPTVLGCTLCCKNAEVSRNRRSSKVRGLLCEFFLIWFSDHWVLDTAATLEFTH